MPNFNCSRDGAMGHPPFALCLFSVKKMPTQRKEGHIPSSQVVLFFFEKQREHAASHIKTLTLLAIFQDLEKF